MKTAIVSIVILVGLHSYADCETNESKSQAFYQLSIGNPQLAEQCSDTDLAKMEEAMVRRGADLQSRIDHFGKDLQKNRGLVSIAENKKEDNIQWLLEGRIDQLSNNFNLALIRLMRSKRSTLRQ